MCFAMSIGLRHSGAANRCACSGRAHRRNPLRRDAAAKATTTPFVIGNDDVLAINVWKEPDISRSIPVRSDGKISLPLVGEVQAAGQTPLKLEQDIATKAEELHRRARSHGDRSANQQSEVQHSGTGEQGRVLTRSPILQRCWMRSLSPADSATSPSRNRFMYCARTPTAPRHGCPSTTKKS